MAGVTGLEPAASGVTGQRSNQLSYTPIRWIGDPSSGRGVWQGSAPVKARVVRAPRFPWGVSGGICGLRRRLPPGRLIGARRMAVVGGDGLEPPTLSV